LDLGCGYGLVGIYAAKVLSTGQVHLLDIDPLAVDASRHNAALNGVAEVQISLSDGFNDTKEMGFRKIISNPPYHADFPSPGISLRRASIASRLVGQCGW
jgi:16S rRNA (guanine1207-N2)-methyltransferase